MLLDSSNNKKGIELWNIRKYPFGNSWKKKHKNQKGLKFYENQYTHLQRAKHKHESEFRFSKRKT